MTSPNLSEREYSELQSELRELRKLKHDVEGRKDAKSKMQIFLMKIWAGPKLTNSLEEWMRVKESNDSSKTITATANLIAAIFRRFMRVGFILILLAVIPMILIVWQNIIMERQNQSLINQIKAERTASSNQQVTEYLRLLLSSDDKEAKAAEGFLVSDVVNRDLAVERLAALLKAGNADVQCSSLRALTRILASSSELTLKQAVAPGDSSRTLVSDLDCDTIDFAGVNFGPITFVDTGFPNSNFKSSDVSEVEFQTNNLRHSDFSESFLCRGEGSCVSFHETDLSYASLTFSHQSKDVFKAGTTLVGAQLVFGQPTYEVADGRVDSGRAEQINNTRLIVPKLPRDNIIAKGVCYDASFSQCYLLHKAKDRGQLNGEQMSTLRQNNCPVNLNGPIVLSSISSCETLGLQPRW